LLAARRGKERVQMADFEVAKDKVMMGAERRSMIMSQEERRNTAYHEAGHALVAKLLPGADPVHKVSIIPRGMALGVTQQVPLDDRHSYTREYILNSLTIRFGGRAAEELILGHITTGAADDIEKATDWARKMVCEWGMSDKLGPMTFGKKEEQIFLGREIAQHQDYSEDTALKIDHEVKRFVTENYQRAYALLAAQKDVLVKMADALLAREVLDADQVTRLAKGLPLDELQPAATRLPAVDEADRPRQKERAPIVPALNAPVPQE
jgi:cell division protease FtsH